MEDKGETSGRQVRDKWETIETGRIQVGDKCGISWKRMEDKWETSGRQVRDKWETSGRQVEDK